MELNYWLFIVTLNMLFATVSCVKKSKLEAKVDALDSLVHGELYFLKETIWTDRQERKEVFKKLNKILEFLEMSTDDRVDKLQVNAYNGRIKTKLKTLSEKAQQNNKANSQMDESQVRIKRGLMKTEKARKADTAAFYTHLNTLRRNEKELNKNQQEIIENQNEIIDNQNKLVNNVTDIRNVTSTNQDDQDDNINVLATKIDALEKTTSELREKSDMLEQKMETELSTCDKTTNKTTQELVLQVSDIAKTVREMKAAVAPNRYCNNQLDLDACLQKHFTSSVQQVLQTLGSVRLVGGRYPHEGRVEVHYQGRHGTVCDDHWGSNDAKVVCRMLGFTGGTAIYGNKVPDGTGEILLDEVACTGDELSLFACKHSGIGVSDCNHREDAGVKCDPKETILSLVKLNG